MRHFILRGDALRQGDTETQEETGREEEDREEERHEEAGQEAEVKRVETEEEREEEEETETAADAEEEQEEGGQCNASSTFPAFVSLTRATVLSAPVLSVSLLVSFPLPSSLSCFVSLHFLSVPPERRLPAGCHGFAVCRVKNDRVVFPCCPGICAGLGFCAKPWGLHKLAFAFEGL